MTNEEKIERLRTIANAEEMTTEDKEFVLELCENLGIKKPIKKNCKMCWAEAVLACNEKLTENESELQDEREYILKKGVDVFFGSVRVNELTLTDEMAEALIARGFDKKFFAKCK